MRHVPRDLALYAITLYQRHLSPYKGFRCAYALHTGCASCSRLGHRAIRRYGLRRGIDVLCARLDRCSAAHARHGAALAGRLSAPPPLLRAPRAQRGFCDALACIPFDAGCLPCDAALPSCDAAACVPADCPAAFCPTPLDCCCSGGDCWPWDRKSRQQRVDAAYVPRPSRGDPLRVHGPSGPPVPSSPRSSSSTQSTLRSSSTSARDSSSSTASAPATWR